MHCFPNAQSTDGFCVGKLRCLWLLKRDPKPGREAARHGKRFAGKRHQICPGRDEPGSHVLQSLLPWLAAGKVRFDLILGHPVPLNKLL